MFKTRYQINIEAVAYNPKIAPLLEDDQDYCIRGMMTIRGFDLYCDWIEGMKEIQDYRLYGDKNIDQINSSLSLAARA